MKKLSTLNSLASRRSGQLSTPKGFTLIELLIVIAILGILAAGILALINPLQQLAKARDATRKSAIKGLNQAMERYAISYKGTYPTDASCGSSCWAVAITSGGGVGKVLKDAGELDIIPTDPNAGRDGDDLYHDQYSFGNSVSACWNPQGKAVVWGWLENTTDPDASHNCGDVTQAIYTETDASGKVRPIYMYVGGNKAP